MLETRPRSAEGTPIDKRGSSGKPFNCATNMFMVNKRPQWELIQYRVDFSPELDETKKRKKLVKECADSQGLGLYIFDGTVIFTPENYFKGVRNSIDLVLMNCSDTVCYGHLLKMGNYIPNDFDIGPL